MSSTDQTLAADTPVRRRGPRGSGVKERLRRSWARWWFAYAMLVPVVLVMGLLVFYPLVRGALYAFTDADRYTIGNSFTPATYSYIGFGNFQTIVTGTEFRSVIAWTAIWTFANVFFHFTIGLGLAVALNRTIRFRGIYRVLLMVPWAVPSFISAFAWRYMFNNPYGLLDHLLRAVGWSNPPAFLGDPFWAKVAVIMTNVWLGVPFMMVALLGGLQSIDKDLLEAAEVDGAGIVRRFWNVTLPGLRPVAATVVLLGLIWTFNMFNVIFLITGGGPANATQILVTYAYRAAFTDYLYGEGAAWGVLILSILLVFGLFYRRMIARLGEETWS